MAEPSGRAVVERFAKAIQDKDFDAQAALIADDYVEEMPQWGERVRGRANRGRGRSRLPRRGRDSRRRQLGGWSVPRTSGF